MERQKEEHTLHTRNAETRGPKCFGLFHHSQRCLDDGLEKVQSRIIKVAVSKDCCHYT